jgi:hypothetical protein
MYKLLKMNLKKITGGCLNSGYLLKAVPFVAMIEWEVAATKL